MAMAANAEGRVVGKKRAGLSKPVAKKKKRKSTNPKAGSGGSSSSKPAAKSAPTATAATEKPISSEAAACFREVLNNFGQIGVLGASDPDTMTTIEALAKRSAKNRRTMNDLIDGRLVQDDAEMRFLIDLEVILTYCEIRANSLRALAKMHGKRASNSNVTLNEADRLSEVVQRCRPVVQKALQPLLERVAQHAGGATGMARHTATGIAKRVAEFGAGVGTQATELAQKAGELAAPAIQRGRTLLEEAVDRVSKLSFVEALFDKIDDDDDDSDVRRSR